MEGEKKGGRWKEEGRRKVGERKGNLPLKFRSGYATACSQGMSPVSRYRRDSN